MVTQEGTIVVGGDQSSGKYSELELQASISLPRGQGICMCVPLVMRLQDDPSVDAPKLQLEYNNNAPSPLLPSTLPIGTEHQRLCSSVARSSPATPRPSDASLNILEQCIFHL
jgi:hypothetical protein